MRRYHALGLLLASAAAAAAAAASSLTPPVLPLIVRNPYLSTWLGHAREEPWSSWPMFWTGSNVGFSVMASDPATRTVYPLLGRPHDSLGSSAGFSNISFPVYDGSSFDASATNLTYRLSMQEPLGSTVKIVLSFLSPITPASTVRQSIPASYMAIYAEGSHDIDVYVDINGEWVTGNRENVIKWEFNDISAASNVTPALTPAPIKFWKITRESEELFTEIDDRAEWGSLYFSGPAETAHQCGESAVLRQGFAKEGTLSGQADNKFRKVMDREPVFAFSHRLRLSDTNGTMSSMNSPAVVFTLAFLQDPIVQFAASRGLTLMRPLWASYFGNPTHLLSFHYGDFEATIQLARNYSDQLALDAYASGANDYQDIAALSARQVLGATQFGGTPDNPLLFLKEISSDGNMQTVDVIFPSFPFFLYTNPQWLAYLLEPLLEHQMSGQYPNQYSMHDLGAHFPNATGHPDGNDEYMPLEECGNMIIMGLALANALRYRSEQVFDRLSHGQLVTGAPGPAPEASSTLLLEPDQFGMDMVRGDGLSDAKAWLSKTYGMWKQWTSYLISEALIPRHQLSTDDFAGWLANQTNLALKGIVGIRAMSEISAMVGQENDSRYYRYVADNYIAKWQDFAISRDKSHAKLAYTWYGSWTTIYNLFADSLLCFHLQSSPAFIPDSIYSMQSRWYQAVLQKYGLPLDSRHLYAKSDWEFFAAAVSSSKIRGAILQSVALWVNETSTDRPLTDLYDTEGSGGFPGPAFFARPVVGGHFSLLALDRACQGEAVKGLAFLDQDDEDPKKRFVGGHEVESYDDVEDGWDLNDL